MTAQLIAKQWGFSLHKPWTRLSGAEKNLVRHAYAKSGAHSSNGVAGWYYSLRKRDYNPRIMENELDEIDPLPYDPITVEDLEDIVKL